MSNIAKQRHRLNSIRARRAGRARANFQGTATRPRLAVFRSLTRLSVQLIDDTQGQTILALTDRAVTGDSKGIARAEALGQLVAAAAAKKGIQAVVFDRRWYRYHGKVRALAEGARTGGLSF